MTLIVECQENLVADVTAARGETQAQSYLDHDDIYCGDARTLLKRVEPNSVALSLWSPPYFVGSPMRRLCRFRGGKTYCAK